MGRTCGNDSDVAGWAEHFTYKGTSTFIDGSTGTAGTSAGAWFYNATTGAITANLATTVVDTKGVAYNTY